MYKPKHLQPWVDYINFTSHCDLPFEDYYVAHWRFFRCTPIERSNHKHIKDSLADCGDDRVFHATFTDSLMILRYYILVHKDNERGLKMADMFAERIKRKGSLNPDLEAHIAEHALVTRWHKSTLESKIDYCQQAGMSIFAARRTDIPDNDRLRAVMSEQ